MSDLAIWKFELHPDRNEYPMPKGAKLLSVALQRGTPCLWALVDPLAEKEIRVLLLTGTGHPIANEAWAFVGTMLTEDQNFVFHVLERIDMW